jgi:hypothetical protein
VLICSAFQFHGHLAQKIIKYMKKGNEVRKGFKIDDVALKVHIERKKIWS